ncbi:MAG: EAL domain-containing protein [Gammaproteobacteria bacterium]|nr:EAL domain-containing protein [Gammaproteobacteria bacterium]
MDKWDYGFKSNWLVMLDQLSKYIIRKCNRICGFKNRFISLKWKITLAINMIIISVGTLILTINIDHLYHHQSKYESVRYQRENIYIQTLIEQSKDKLFEFSELLLSSSDIKNILLADNPGSIKTVFTRYWNTIQGTTTVGYIALYNSKLSKIGEWGNLLSKSGNRRHIIKTEKIAATVTSESPQSYLACIETCNLYVSYPVLIQGMVSGVLVSSTRLVDLLLIMHKSTKADIGVLVPIDRNYPEFNNLKLDSWGYRISSLTNKQSSYDILYKLERVYSIPEFNKKTLKLQQYNKYYTADFIPIGEGSNAGLMALLYDDTEVMTTIKNEILLVIVIGIVGLLLLQIFITHILWRPLIRLRNTAHTLPMLADSKYETVRNSVISQLDKGIYQDELDILDETTVELSYELEILHNNLEEKNVELSSVITDIKKNRDFVSQLLNNAQILVLTLSKDMKIMSINKFSENILNVGNGELLQANFKDVFPMDKDYEEQFNAMLSGSRDSIKNESVINVNGSDDITIDWIHSILPVSSNEDSYVLSVGSDVSQRKEIEKRLSWLADHDALTGLFNRRRFAQEVKSLLSDSKRYSRTGALFYMDLDDFKDINDTVGHYAGDMVLKAISNILSKNTRETDIISRIGGDEFCVLIKEVDEKDALMLAKKIEGKILNKKILINGKHYSVGCSIGIAMFPEHGDNYTDLLSNADMAMYKSKQSYNNSINLFSKTDFDKESTHDRIYWSDEIKDAIKNNRFALYYQPIINIQNNNISHYEVLLRMLSPMGRIIMPLSFIPIAEKSDLINMIDRWVIKTAILKLQDVHKTEPDITFSINISGKAINDAEFLPMIHDLLISTSVDPSKLIFEVTETVAVSDFEQATLLIENLKSLGCKFAIDDFGVGYSSFYYMKKLPIDFVKIDGSFIKELHRSHDDQVFVKALCEVAKGFGKKTIAEFVENDDVLKLLMAYEVDYAQGYFIGKPSDKLVSEINNRSTYIQIQPL